MAYFFSRLLTGLMPDSGYKLPIYIAATYSLAVDLVSYRWGYTW